MFGPRSRLFDTLFGLAFVVAGVLFVRPWPKAAALSAFGVAYAAWGWWRAPDVKERARLQREEQSKRTD